MSQLKLPSDVPALEKPGVARNSLSPLQWDMRTIGPPKATHYFPISLGDSFRGPAATGVFLPVGFTYPSKVDVTLFFHGDRGDSYACDHIKQYWGGNYPTAKAAPYGPVTLRQDMNDSPNKSVWSSLLIAPTLGVNPRYNAASIGDFLDKSAVATGGYLTQALHELAGVEPKAKDSFGAITGYEREPEVGKIILASHSAGGRPMLRQAQLMPKNRICEVWAFDALFETTPAAYGGEIAKAWFTVIRNNPGTKFFYHFGTEAPIKHSRDLESSVKGEGLQNASFIEGPTGGDAFHFAVLTKNFPDRLKAANCTK
jgi:hypothetical protein